MRDPLRAARPSTRKSHRTPAPLELVVIVCIALSSREFKLETDETTSSGHTSWVLSLCCELTASPAVVVESAHIPSWLNGFCSTLRYASRLWHLPGYSTIYTPSTTCNFSASNDQPTCVVPRLPSVLPDLRASDLSHSDALHCTGQQSFSP